MPGKLINTLKYGSAKTKRKIYLMFGVLAAGAMFIIAALIFSNVLLGLAAFVILFIDGMILFNTSFEQKTVSVVNEEKPKNKEKKKKEKKKQSEEEEPGALEWISSEKKEKKEKATDEQRPAESPEELPDEEEKNPLLQYDEKKLKKIMVAYKVKKHHVPIMIDSCKTERITQSPAYLWKDSSYLYFLVLEEEPRMIKSKLAESEAIHIRRGMIARPMEEYNDMNTPSVVSMIFGSLLPKYYKKENGMYRMEYRKNLYSAAPGIWCTSASVKNLMKLLPNQFVLEDGKVDAESTYYQEIYIARIMYWDGIYSGQEYKEKVLEILSSLVNSELSEATMRQYLNAMMMKGLIPREYADYAMKKRKNR